MSLIQMPTAADQSVYPPTSGEAAFSGSRGLVGKVNAGTPLTKYDLSADAVILKNPVNETIVRTSVAAITCDLGLTGPAANGRDQAGVFGVTNFIHLYFIWNGSTVATLASLTAPPIGPVLPSGYTHWCYATCLVWNGSSNIIPMRTQGSQTWFDLATGGVNRVQGNSTAIVFTATGTGNLVPTNALTIQLWVLLNFVHTSPLEFQLFLRPTGASGGGQVYIDVVTQVAASTCAASSYVSIFPGTSAGVEYKISSAPATSGGAFIDVLGFTLPNGG